MKSILSESETKLYNFIKENEKITIKKIQEELGDKIVGGLGRLMKNEIVEKVKVREGEGYEAKTYVYYQIKEETTEE